MARRGRFDGASKSAYSYEAYDSGWELEYMEHLERDPLIAKWTKRHGLVIPWIDSAGRVRHYRPDYLIERTDGLKEVHEVKGAHLLALDSTQRKLLAGQRWCERRNWVFRLVTKG